MQRATFATVDVVQPRLAVLQAALAHITPIPSRLTFFRRIGDDLMVTTSFQVQPSLFQSRDPNPVCGRAPK